MFSHLLRVLLNICNCICAVFPLFMQAAVKSYPDVCAESPAAPELNCRKRNPHNRPSCSRQRLWELPLRFAGSASHPGIMRVSQCRDGSSSIYEARRPLYKTAQHHLTMPEFALHGDIEW